MPLETNLNTFPYWDDYSEQKDFYRILFKPGVSVQTRELNQLQSIVQKQIERFGDHVFKSGTIVSGVNFVYNPLLPYVKLFDLQEDGQPTNVNGYLNLLVRDSSNLQAYVVHGMIGYESQDPDLNTIYLRYINSGNTYNISRYSNNSLLEVVSPKNIIFDIDVQDGGVGFSNADSVEVISAVKIQRTNSSIAFTNGNIITQATTNARLRIVGITDVGDGYDILRLKPLDTDLSNTSANSLTWTVETGYLISNSTITANVVSLIGSGAAAVITTDSLGVVQNITMSENGEGYTTLPVAVIKPTSATASVATLDIRPRNYKAKIRVANSAFSNPVGFGYSFAVTEGVIYQKGFFSRVSPQYIIVSKYNQSPNNISVGFSSDESVVKYTADESLYDNATGTYNEGAPGADRLKISPRLRTMATDAAAEDQEFLPLVEFQNGFPVKENRVTVYKELAKEFERRTVESAGDYVINSPTSVTEEITSNNSHFAVVVDPYIAYISGKRVQAVGYTKLATPKASSYASKTDQTISANYGNYVFVNNLAGFFNFKAGVSVDLYDTAQSYINNVTIGSSASITPSGNKIGTAKMRSLVYESGTFGTPEAKYRLYLFDISLNSGKSFRDVKSFYYDGANYDGLCDAVQETDPTTNAVVTYLYETNKPNIIFATGLSAVKSITNISYTYRTSQENIVLTTGGTLQITAPATYKFPYSGSTTLTGAQKTEFFVAPVSNVSSANLSGTVTCNTSSANLIGSSTTFTSDFKEGDYVRVFNNSSSFSVRRVVSVVNNTLIVLNSAPSYSNSSGANTTFFIPAYYPIPLHDRSDRTITTSADSSVATININKSIAAQVNTVCFYNIKIPSATQINKDLNRTLYVKIYTGNNTTLSASGNNTTGPWSLGVPDVLRLKNVYFGNTTSNTNVTDKFFVSSQSDGDYVRNAQLFIKPNTRLSISNTQWLLVEFDSFDINTNEGFVTINSYNDLINDNSGFANNTYINRLEVPEVLTSEGKYYDLIDCFDFRPYATNTAVLTSTVASASINPANTQDLNSDEKFFPVPDSAVTFDADYYLPRVDILTISSENKASVTRGVASETGIKMPQVPANSLVVNRYYIPPYPSLPYALTENTVKILDRKIGNEGGTINNRMLKYQIKKINTISDKRSLARKYSMADIGKLEKRIEQLEYTVALSQLESTIKDLSIPSKNDPTINRFKNAFLVDDFNSYSSSNYNNKQFSAYIDTIAGELLPFTASYNVESMLDRSDATTSGNIINSRFLMLPYDEETLINQSTSSYLANNTTTNNRGTDIVSNVPSSNNGSQVVGTVDDSDANRVTVAGPMYQSPSYGTIFIGSSEVELPPSTTTRADPSADPDDPSGEVFKTFQEQYEQPYYGQDPLEGALPSAPDTRGDENGVPLPNIIGEVDALPAPADVPFYGQDPLEGGSEGFYGYEDPYYGIDPLSTGIEQQTETSVDPSAEDLFYGYGLADVFVEGNAAYYVGAIPPAEAATVVRTDYSTYGPGEGDNNTTAVIDAITIADTLGGGPDFSDSMGCPDPSMRIMLSDGSYIEAGNLKSNMFVRTKHEHTLEEGSFRVKSAVLEMQPKMSIIFDDLTFICSKTHRFYSNGKWVYAHDVKVGDDLSGKIVRQINHDLGVGEVVKISIEQAQTYVAEGLLSHNVKTVDFNIFQNLD